MQNVDLFFLLLGAVLVLAMHAGFAFLELGTVRHKNQVGAALSKILTDFAISAIALFLVVLIEQKGLADHRGTTDALFLPAHLLPPPFQRLSLVVSSNAAALPSHCHADSGCADLSIL